MSMVPDPSTHASDSLPATLTAQQWLAPSPPTVRATLSYLVPGDEKPVHYSYEPPPGEPWESGRYEETQISIGDARMLAGQPSIHREGFELWDAPTELRNYNDPDEIRRAYYPELEALAKRVTGGRRAYVFDHLVRQRESDRGPLTFGRSQRGQHAAPNARIHNDYTEQSGRRRLSLVLGADISGGPMPRYCIINVWRSLRGPVLDTPLAICDARSVDASDLVEAEVRYPRRNGEIYLAVRAQRHSWWHYSGLDRHEALVFKQYDSRLSGVSRFVPHAAFLHPEAPADALPRISIEARCLVLMD